MDIRGGADIPVCHACRYSNGGQECLPHHRRRKAEGRRQKAAADGGCAGMATDAEVFLEKIRALFGKENSVKRIGPTRPGLPPVALFIHHNVPEPGWMTAVT